VQIAYHRDIECGARSLPVERVPVVGKGSWDSPHVGTRRLKSRALGKSFCPTCRGELSRVRDALTCMAGCTSEAARM